MILLKRPEAVLRGAKRRRSPTKTMCKFKEFTIFIEMRSLRRCFTPPLDTASGRLLIHYSG